MSDTNSDNLDEFARTMNQIARDQRVAMSEFNDAMKRRDNINERNSRRGIGLHQLLMLCLVLLVGILLFMTVTLHRAVDELGAAGGQSKVAATTTAVTDGPAQQQVLADMDATITALRQELATMQQALGGLEQKLAATNSAAPVAEPEPVRAAPVQPQPGYPYAYPYQGRGTP